MIRLLLCLHVLLWVPATVVATVYLYSGCICSEPVNYCSDDAYPYGYVFPYKRCHLNSSIVITDNVSQNTPSWVTPDLTKLVVDTVDQASAGNISDVFTPSMICDYGNGPQWVDFCSVNAGGFLTGFALLGFHPHGNHSGTWLTQIIGQISNADTYLEHYSCPPTADEFYVTISKVNDSAPYDVIFRTEPTGVVRSLRTDNDLLVNGVDLQCSRSANTSVYNIARFDCSQPDFAKNYSSFCFDESANVTYTSGSNPGIDWSNSWHWLALLLVLGVVQK
jgi:hypothetical protein